MNQHKPLTAASLLAGGSGNAVVELALVIPVLILLALAALDVAHSLSRFQIGTALSRELASVAFRHCAVDRSGAQSDDDNRGVGGSLSGQCLEKVLNRFETAFAGEIADDSAFVLSLYTRNDDGSAYLEGRVGASTGEYSEAKLTPDTAANAALANSLENYQLIVIAEAYIPRGIPRLQPFSPNIIYSCTIL